MNQPTSAQSSARSGSDHSYGNEEISQDQRDITYVAAESVDEVLSATDTLILYNSDPPERQWLEQLFTPWGLTAFSVLLLSNLLLSWSLLSGRQQASLAPNSPTVKPVTPQTEEIPSDRLNLAKSPSNSLALNSLSLLPADSGRTTGPSLTVVQPSNPPAIPTHLSDALLPPASLPIQPVPNTSIAPSVIQPPAPPQETAPVSVKPTIGNLPAPPPPPSSSVTQGENSPSTEDRLRQSLRQQLQMEQENAPPLGFNQQTRLEEQTRQNQLDPAQLPYYQQQLQQLQQQYRSTPENNVSSP